MPSFTIVGPAGDGVLLVARTTYVHNISFTSAVLGVAHSVSVAAAAAAYTFLHTHINLLLASRGEI
jgi:hypothetical protein